MVLIENFWNEVLAGPDPDQGMRMITTKPLNLKRCIYEGKGNKSLLMPESPPTPATPVTPSSARKENVWRSVFNPGSNLATKGIGAALFDKPQPNTPTVYDWLYSDDTRSKHH
ncbi:auxin-repressed 12.5 kDa protein-like [Macadamia integrifolia]|uniref:auxin-repressed 12.5 kDa protein-like n=1 Tax=Macadamia integrifolia TaxID=60698 RepID=UPI001C52CFC1|nr:auxin-repressed 12.5 kDa protein-like [Macadamia integrifolia]